MEGVDRAMALGRVIIVNVGYPLDVSQLLLHWVVAPAEAHFLVDLRPDLGLGQLSVHLCLEPQPVVFLGEFGHFFREVEVQHVRVGVDDSVGGQGFGVDVLERVGLRLLGEGDGLDVLAEGRVAGVESAHVLLSHLVEQDFKALVLLAESPDFDSFPGLVP